MDNDQIIAQLQDEILNLRSIVVDLVDGNATVYDIQYFTGLGDERCEEIVEVYSDIIKSNKWRK